MYIRLRESNLYLLYTLQRTISEKIVIDNKWTVDGEVTDRSVLSDELAALCAKYPIYSLKVMEDTMTSKRIQTDGEHATHSSTDHLKTTLDKIPDFLLGDFRNLLTVTCLFVFVTFYLAFGSMWDVIKIKIIFTLFIKACSKCTVDFTICPELGNFSLILLPSVCKYGHRWYIP